VEWHPLADHCADVAVVVEGLVRLPVWRDRLARLAGQQLTDVCWARICVLAALDDIGKLNLGFQAKGRPALGATAGHVKEALGALFRRPGVFSCLDELATQQRIFWSPPSAITANRTTRTSWEMWLGKRRDGRRVTI